MFLLEKPYVSDFLKQTVEGLAVSVLDTPVARQALGDSRNILDEASFVRGAIEDENARLYSNSENAIEWMTKNLGAGPIPERIRIFKDKVAFREMLRPMYPEYGFKGVPFDQLRAVDPSDFSKPFIVKPAVGFFSLGVHKVDSDAQWTETVSAIEQEVDQIKKQYPQQVLDLGLFIIEEMIAGEEFAVDVYWDDMGTPVIINVLAHMFPDENNVNDRVYITSRKIVQQHYEAFEKTLLEMGRLAGLRNYPGHVELRVDDQGVVAPIEGNPMRFAGWCVADLTWHAWGFNPYEYYLQNKRPDWEAIFAARGGMVTSVVIADVAPDVDAQTVRDVDYEGFAGHFKSVLELRRIDWKEYPVFAFLFAEHAPDALDELDWVLRSDLKEFLTL